MSEHRPEAVLLCFACEPGAGSEEGVGWTWLQAAASIADVTVLTTAANAPLVRDASAELGLTIEVHTVDLPVALRRLFPRKLIFVRYVVWQAQAARLVRQIERHGTVDVVHHVTWASDSLPTTLTASRAPIRIWGPVGGSTTTAPGLYRYLGARGKIDRTFRDLVNGALRAVFGRRAARHASLVVALNPDVARRLGRYGTPVALEGNLALHPDELTVDPDTIASRAPLLEPRPDARTALFAGRLIPWKGLLLSIRSLAHAPGWRLVVAGEGPDRARAEALAASLGVTDRVAFCGRIPRAEVLAAFGWVDALLQPSFHDSAPWSVGEASALGCPVVCLDAGGPALMAGTNGHVVTIGDGDRLPERIGAALAGLEGRGVPDPRWSADRLPALLQGWYRPAPIGSQATAPTPGAAHGVLR